MIAIALIYFNNLSENKAVGLIIYKHIIATKDILSTFYYELFNLVIESGYIPESWSAGSIEPIYKKKADANRPENYRLITLLSCLSCLGKLFTRLNKYVEENNPLSEIQACFRTGYSTVDHIFVLNNLMDILKSTKTKLFCVFIRFSKRLLTAYGELGYGRNCFPTKYMENSLR